MYYILSGHVSPQTQSTSRMDTKPEDPVALHGMMDSPLRGHLGLKSSRKYQHIICVCLYISQYITYLIYEFI